MPAGVAPLVGAELVAEEPELPPHAESTESPTIKSPMKASALPPRACRRERRETKGIANPASTLPVGRNGSNDSPEGEAVSCAVAALVEMVSVEVAALPFKVTDAAEKLHAAPPGNPEHAKLTEPLKPPGWSERQRRLDRGPPAPPTPMWDWPQYHNRTSPRRW